MLDFGKCYDCPGRTGRDVVSACQLSVGTASTKVIRQRSGRSDLRDVGNEVQDVDDRVQGIDGNVGVDDKLDQANRLLSFNPDRYSTGSDSFTGKQLRDRLLQWHSPLDPLISHNIACKAHYDGTTQWFFKRSIFSQ